MLDSDDFTNAIMEEMQDTTKYFLKVSGDTEKEEYTGTKLEIAEQYIEAKGWVIEYRPMEDGDGYEAVLLDPDNDTEIANEWANANDGSDTVAKYSIYSQLIEYFYDELDYLFCDEADAECFTMEYTELLEDITAREIWENEDFDISDEKSVREWYCYERETPASKKTTHKISNFEKVKDFMTVFEQNDRANLLVNDPTQDKAIELRFGLISEEYRETLVALNVWRNHIEFQGTSERYDREICEAATEIIDGLGDMLYVIYGAFVLFSIDANEAFSRIHESNMSKLEADGKAAINSDGKICKGAGFYRPKLADLILGAKSAEEGSGQDNDGGGQVSIENRLRILLNRIAEHTEHTSNDFNKIKNLAVCAKKELEEKEKAGKETKETEIDGKNSKSSVRTANIKKAEELLDNIIERTREHIHQTNDEMNHIRALIFSVQEESE